MFCSSIKKYTQYSLVGMSVLLAACGGDSSNDSDSDSTDQKVEVSELCGQSVQGVNWDALAADNCTYLSSYNLFADNTNPSTGPLSGGIAYDLSTPLFTDYASKYRFVFVPENTQATYSDKEAFEFPVGTVLVKTFTVPQDTGARGFANENLIETRLLIHRESGWTALPYVWNEEKTDATYQKAGAQIQGVTLVHNGEQKEFTYVVPDQNNCKQCHQLEDESGISRFSPIGPKARYLNNQFDYATGAENQLTHWQDAGILTGVPSDLSSIDTAAQLHDSDHVQYDWSSMSQAEIEPFAKSYLDINCAHCHRDGGGASNTGFHVEYWRPFSEAAKHGVCKTPIANGGNGDGTDFDMVPGRADLSFIVTRMDSDEPGMKMPEVGRSLIHGEGVELIKAWINSMPLQQCGN